MLLVILSLLLLVLFDCVGSANQSIGLITLSRGSGSGTTKTLIKQQSSNIPNNLWTIILLSVSKTDWMSSSPSLLRKTVTQSSLLLPTNKRSIVSLSIDLFTVKQLL